MSSDPQKTPVVTGQDSGEDAGPDQNTHKASKYEKETQNTIIQRDTTIRTGVKITIGTILTAIISAIFAAIITPDSLPRLWNRGIGWLDNAQFEGRRAVARAIFDTPACSSNFLDEKQALASLQSYQLFREQITSSAAEDMFLANIAGESVIWKGFLASAGDERSPRLVISTYPEYYYRNSIPRDNRLPRNQIIICEMSKQDWETAKLQLGDQLLDTKVEFSGILSVSSSRSSSRIGTLQSCSLRRIIAF